MPIMARCDSPLDKCFIYNKDSYNRVEEYYENYYIP